MESERLVAKIAVVVILFITCNVALTWYLLDPINSNQIKIYQQVNDMNRRLSNMAAVQALEYGLNPALIEELSRENEQLEIENQKLKTRNESLQNELTAISEHLDEKYDFSGHQELYERTH